MFPGSSLGFGLASSGAMIDLARFCDARLSVLAFLIFSRWVGVKSHSDNLPGNTLPKGPPARMRSTYTSTAASVTGVLLEHFHSKRPCFGNVNQIAVEFVSPRSAICPCGVVQSTCLPLMQEITGAKPVRDANFRAPKALSMMRSLGKRA